MESRAMKVFPKLACLSSVYSSGQNWEEKNHIHSESPLQFVKRLNKTQAISAREMVQWLR